MQARILASLSVCALTCLLFSCSDDTTDTDPASGGTGGSTSTSTGGGATGGQGGSGGQGGQEYVPAPEDVNFTPLAPIPAGEQIIFNDWSFPDMVRSMAPDGSGVVDIFSIYRVWSMAVSRAGDQLAFSCGDPNQEQHYGLNLGDAIQHTWMYDFASETIEVVAYGNINDECHHFGPGDNELYLCRRYDFTAEATFSGYRLGRIDLADNGFEFLTADEPQKFALNPQLDPAGANLYFSLVEIQGTSQTRTIRRQAPMPNQTAEVIRSNAHRPLLSPDASRYLYADSAQMSKLYSSTLANTDETLVADINGTSASYSPDGSKVAYLVWDGANSCSDVQVVASDGSEATNPTTIRDCSETGEFITELSWFVRP